MPPRQRPARRSLRTGLRASSALGALVLAAGTASAADYVVTNNNDSGGGSLRQAIINSNSSLGPNTITINSGIGTIALASDLPQVASNVTISGNGATISGSNQYRGLTVAAFYATTPVAVDVTIENLTIANARAQGGAGAQGGGGGAGLGGALFVADQANLTVRRRRWRLGRQRRQHSRRRTGRRRWLGHRRQWRQRRAERLDRNDIECLAGR